MSRFVVQIFDPLYRRIDFGRVICKPARSNNSARRRLQICDTADYKSALRFLRVLRASAVFTSSFRSFNHGYRDPIEGKEFEPQRPEERRVSAAKIGYLSLCEICLPTSLSGRTFENSPPIYRWVNVSKNAEPRRGERGSTNNKVVLPSLTGLINSERSDPPINRWAIFFRPIGWDSWLRLAAVQS